LGKTKHGGVRLSNLIRIKTSSIPAIIERDCETSHLKIGLLINVRPLTSKAVIVNELITDHNLDMLGQTETWLNLLVTLVTISPAHPAKAEVLLTFTIANFNLQKKLNVFVF
jgi:hypothetical protein